MKNSILLIILVLFLISCSTPKPKNQWQYEATSSLNDYKKHFLQNRLLRAKSDLSHARQSASQSAALHTRIDIELSVCALNIAVLKQDRCEKASMLLKIEPDIAQSAYLHLLQKNYKKEEIALLPSSYKSFAKALLDADDINTELSNISSTSSKAIATALAKDMANKKSVQELIESLSFRGYKNALISWLSFQVEKEANPKQKAIIKAKIKLLTYN